jgi:fucose 4-O-acetylase-like acetyltransferase
MRTLWVDYTKAVGIMLVVYGHVSRGLYNAKIPMNEDMYKLIDRVIYSFHMPLFFFLSGLFFYGSLRKRGLKAFVANKLDTILYLYVIWSVLQGATGLIFQQWTNNNVSLNEVSNLFLEPIMQFWFLYALFFITLISGLLYAKIDQKYTLALFLLCTLLVIFKVPSYGFTPLIYVIPYLCFFMFGIYFNHIEGFFITYKHQLLPVFGCLFLGAQWLLLSWLTTIPAYLLPTIQLMTTLISILFSVIFCMWLADKQSKLISAIGVASMAIFLMHVISGSGARIVLQHFLGINNFWIHLLIGCITGIFGSMLLQKLFTKIGLSFLLAIPQALSLERKLTKVASIID